MFDGIKRMFRQANLTGAELEALNKGEAAVVKFDEEITREKVELLVTGRAHISKNPPKGIKRPRKPKKPHLSGQEAEISPESRASTG